MRGAASAGRLEIPGGHPRIFPGPQGREPPPLGFSAAELGASVGRARGRCAGRGLRGSGAAGAAGLLQPARALLARPPAHPRGPPLRSRPGLPQPALELQQERLELDSGKNRSGRDQPVRAEEATADFVQDSSPLLQKRPPPPPTAGLEPGLEAGDCQCWTQVLAGRTLLLDRSPAQARLFPDCGVSDSGSRG